MNTLYLKKTKTGSHYSPFWHPYENQQLAMKHFSGGDSAITDDRLDEIVYVAGIHGWEVETEIIEKP
jgi:hypothetical protein